MAAMLPFQVHLVLELIEQGASNIREHLENIHLLLMNFGLGADATHGLEEGMFCHQCLPFQQAEQQTANTTTKALRSHATQEHEGEGYTWDQPRR